jgi:hypothetical protein
MLLFSASRFYPALGVKPSLRRLLWLAGGLNRFRLRRFRFEQFSLRFDLHYHWSFRNEL